ncbi:hypothetical protein OH77DRAFT_293793 [Trametes cingulata]|nr:hypothetical protein OH77DRAFT_293793 [Trametes cingulata]
MAKSKKSKGVSNYIRRYSTVETRPGSTASTVLTSKRLRQQALQREKEENQRKLNQALSGLSGRAVEQIRDLHARPGQSSAEADGAQPEQSYQDLQDAGDAMDVDGWVDEDEEDSNEDILHALRDFMGDRCVVVHSDSRCSVNDLLPQLEKC